MRVEHLAESGSGGGHPLSTFLVDGRLALDAGSLGWCRPPDELARIGHILLTHGHIDHCAGLPIFLDTVYGLAPTPPVVYAPAGTLDSLRRDLFNGRLMPDFVTLSLELPPFLEFRPVEAGVPFAAGPYTVTAYAVDHGVPTVAYLVDDGADAIALVTDTAPVPEVVRQIAAHPRLRTVYLEASFPAAESALATVSKHLTTATFLELARLIPEPIAVVPVHIKPRFAEAVRRELADFRRGTLP